MKQIIFITFALSLTACDTNHRIFRDGVDGKAGSSCSVTQTPTGAEINCQDGSSATLTNGQTGANGVDGGSCSVAQANDASGALISCQDGSNVFVSNGAVGPAGPQGVPGMNATSVEMVKLCPNSPENTQHFAEYGIKVGTKVYAVYSGTNAALVLLAPGTYTTTAPTHNCTFTVNSNGSVSN